LVDKFKSIGPGVGVPNPQDPLSIASYTTTFDVVTRFPIRGSEALMGCELSIIDFKEKKKTVMQYMDCHLIVTTEFRYRLQLGDVPLTEANRILTDIQMAMRSDINCGGLTVNVSEISNELDVDHGGTHIVSGIVFWEVRYRHRWDDPRRQVGY